jgi:hypothetical protein
MYSVHALVSGGQIDLEILMAWRSYIPEMAYFFLTTNS